MRALYFLSLFCCHIVLIHANNTIEYFWSNRPTSANSYGIDNGVVIFPDTVHSELREKHKAVYPNSQWLPLIGEIYWSEVSRPYSSDVNLAWNMNTAIPQTDTFLKSIIDMVGGEKNFVQMMKKNNKPVRDETTGMIIQKGSTSIHIMWSEYRCENPRISPQSDYIYRPTSIWLDDSYRSCMLEEKKNMYANTVNNKQFRIQSETEQEMTFQIFPVDPKNYKFWSSNGSRILFIDPLLDYHNMHILIGRFGYIPPEIWKENITKKYKRFSYTGTFVNTIVLYPYYEVTVTIPQWESKMDMMYYSYTPTDGNAFFIVE